MGNHLDLPQGWHTARASDGPKDRPPKESYVILILPPELRRLLIPGNVLYVMVRFELASTHLPGVHFVTLVIYTW